MIKVGIIGAGRIGKVHCQSIGYIKDVVVEAIADPKINEEIKIWASKIGIKKVYDDYREILNDKEITAVLICSSTDTHSQISLEAIAAGKHVFCEKPVDHSVTKIMEVMKALKNSKVKYQVGFNRRFDHNFAAARKAVAAGKIGELNILKITSRDPAPPPVNYIACSGGIFLDMTIHDFDMVRFMSGAEVEEVYAIGGVM
ncbi:MAG: inositol 2-dehydrogenase, partial [Clostridia bacterium]|nr:inositol 2-dehydrogenase [Clostridia bacterium]